MPPAALPRPPAGVLVTSSAKLPPPLKRFQPGQLAGATHASLHILFPPDGAKLDVPAADGKLDLVPLKVTGAVAPVTILVNGLPIAAEGHGTLFFKPNGPGFSRVTVIDSSGAAASIMVRVDDGSSAAGSVHAADAVCPITPCNQRAGTAVAP
jgi:penicillin-binding protein 1C